MNTSLQTRPAAALPALPMPEAELMDVLRNSLYPGARDQSIRFALGYCKAAGLDPMQKPVHIVPMYDKASKSMRDIIMPGIGSYRVQAARTGEYAGISEPEFGPDVYEEMDGVKITYPMWCRVTVRRLLPNGAQAEFTATERWVENYATQSKDSSAPNSMWKKRPYGQLAKCAEAQALRKAFPEVGSQPTADEMEGKSLDYESGPVIENNTSAPLGQQKAAALPPPAYYDGAQFDTNFAKWSQVIGSGRKGAGEIITFIEAKGARLTDEQKARLLSVRAAPAPEAPAAPPAPAASAPPTRPASHLTAAQIRQRIDSAQTAQDLDLDALDEAIGALADPREREELVQRLTALPPF